MAAKQYVWMDGRFIDFDKANVHVLTHSLQYGSGIFEGIRAYSTEKGPAVFRLAEHAARFINSAKIVGMELGFSKKQVADVILSTIKKNGLASCYIRPFAFYNDQQIGLNITGKKVSFAVAAIPFGNYFQTKDKGISCKVASWQRINSHVLPPQAKASANYLNSILASQEAKHAGYDEAVLLSPQGHVAEGPGENIFLVRDGRLLTPGLESDILPGITRDSIIKLASRLDIIVEERAVHREELYTCDEAFFTGTAAEMTPITSVDSRKIGDGKPGPITALLSERFAAIAHGKDSEYSKWLTFA